MGGWVGGWINELGAYAKDPTHSLPPSTHPSTHPPPSIYAGAMLTLGPSPFLDTGLMQPSQSLGWLLASLIVLGITETFIFLPFIPLFHRRFRKKMGWSALETEDTVGVNGRERKRRRSSVSTHLSIHQLKYPKRSINQPFYLSNPPTHPPTHPKQ